ncbi:MAG: adenylyl cyclase [Isosphaeraceae bacterium]|jgi:adenylate cyclase class 2|nr:MAG: adenylyl cyclase [Isosphaeraceae bacterium]
MAQNEKPAETFEIEMKFMLTDPEAFRRRLAALGYQLLRSDDQADLYFRHPTRDFAQSREAFRLRRHGLENRLTYKGPKHGGPTKTREELEVGFEAGPEAGERLQTLLERLGFEPVAEVRKHRQTYGQEGSGLTVVIDEVDGLGTFAEVEAVAGGADELARSQEAVLDLARRLDLGEPEPRSYLRMWLERWGESTGRDGANVLEGHLAKPASGTP